ncbi:MAG: hypothetical protein IB618_00555 [Candidatus Pacearchaeota archaeon]|nr:MAG: hypothetical protein IB618_00555 [Candidatus Pacearchaeota archaeon]
MTELKIRKFLPEKIHEGRVKKLEKDLVSLVKKEYPDNRVTTRRYHPIPSERYLLLAIDRKKYLGKYLQLFNKIETTQVLDLARRLHREELLTKVDIRLYDPSLLNKVEKMLKNYDYFDVNLSVYLKGEGK